MMAHDAKYGRVTTEKKDIPDDEPVFLIRAQDEGAVSAINGYAEVAYSVGASDAFVEWVRTIADEIRDWQEEHRDRVKVPD
jgi:hypothetical protein